MSCSNEQRTHNDITRPQALLILKILIHDQWGQRLL